MNSQIISSVVKKLIMSISGAFLILFISFHMTMNIVALFSVEAYNALCEFLGANWYALAGTLVLAGGVAIHVIMALWLTITNRIARGNLRYAVTRQEPGVSWASKNMLVLGFVILGGLLLHLYNFWFHMQFTEIIGRHENAFGFSPSDGGALIQYWFSQPLFVVLYLIWFAAIWLHLTHGFWSMFQSVGWANAKWYPRLKWIANIYATLIIAGFAAVAIIFYIKSLCS